MIYRLLFKLMQMHLTFRENRMRVLYVYIPLRRCSTPPVRPLHQIAHTQLADSAQHRSEVTVLQLISLASACTTKLLAFDTYL